MLRAVAICVIVLLDQATKSWVQGCLLHGERIVVAPGFFDLRYVRNTGAAWGLLTGWRLLLIGFSVAMLALLLRRRRELFGGWRGGNTAWVLLMAGIAGNLIDRVRLGYVVDFLDFYHRDWHFPAFNVADSAICIGIGLYLLSQFLNRAHVSQRQQE
ncbi:MAG: signal peptidase II [Kiritimatiellae bacterium]|nr:signal peptidase II [Kiritimatiellia bacterium]